MNNILRLVLTLLFDSYLIVYIVFRILYILGAWKMMEKSGLKGWWSLIPWVREYQLARCAFREPEANTYALISMALTALKVLNIVLEYKYGTDVAVPIIAIVLAVLVSVMLMHFIYNIRIYAGFIEVYGLKRAWLILCIIDELRFIPMLIWGFSDKYQPAWKVTDLKAEMQRLATHGSIAETGDGLSVNLEKREVRELFRKKVLLRDIHMAIPQGHMVLLLGGSGAGKSTLLNTLTGEEVMKTAAVRESDSTGSLR